MNRSGILKSKFREVAEIIASATGRLWNHRSAVDSRLYTPPVSLPERLPAFSRALLVESSGVESDFLRLGRKLQSIHEDASALVRSAHDATALVNGNGDEGLLSRIDRVVHSALSEFHTCREKVSLNVGSFRRGAALMAELCGLCRGIDKMVLELQMVGLTIGVESVRTREGSELFGLVASDVRELSKKIADISESIHEGAHNVRGLQETALGEISGDIDRMSAVSADAEKEVRSAVGNIKHLMAISTSAMDRIGEQSREISKWVGWVVEGVQFHDNMHQRICHITEALTETAQRSLNADPGGTSGEEGCPVTENDHAVIVLQTAQLRQVIGEVDEAHQKTTRAFEEIARHVGELAGSISSFNSDTGDTPGADGPSGAKRLFSELHGAVERFSGLLDQGRRLNGKMQDTFDHAASSANRLSQAAARVRKINFDIHLLSLNAIVKASHMGSEGTALEVLAQAVKGLSDRSNGFVAQVGALLNDIGNTGRDDTEETGPPAPAINGAGMAAEGTAIMHTYKAVAGISSDIASRAEGLIQSISAAREDLAFLGGLKDRLDEHLLALEDLNRQTRPMGGAPEKEASRLTDRLTSRYTTAQERMVHDRLTKGPGELPLPPSPEPVSADNDDIEWFDMTGPVIEPAPDAMSPGSDLGENVELF